VADGGLEFMSFGSSYPNYASYSGGAPPGRTAAAGSRTGAVGGGGWGVGAGAGGGGMGGGGGGGWGMGMGGMGGSGGGMGMGFAAPFSDSGPNFSGGKPQTPNP
jgi:hypothetical protein